MSTTTPLSETDFGILDGLVRREFYGDSDIPYDPSNLGSLEAKNLVTPYPSISIAHISRERIAALTPKGRTTHAEQLVARVIAELFEDPNRDCSGYCLNDHFQGLAQIVESKKKEESVPYLGDRNASKVRGHLVSIGWAETDGRFVRPSEVGQNMYAQLSKAGYFSR